MEENKQKSAKEKAFFDLKCQLQRIATSIKRLNESRVDRYMGSYEEIAKFYVFATDEFCDKMAENLSKVPFSSDEAMVAAKFLKSREWDSNGRKYYVLREKDLPSSNIWKIIGDILVAVVNDHNGFREFNSDLYLEHPAAYGYASRGLDSFRIELFDTEDEVIKEWAKTKNSWYAIHDTLREMALHGSFDESEKFIGISEYNFDNEGDNNVKVVVKMGEFWECKNCGERIYFCDVPPETIYGFWRQKFLSYE